MADKQFKDKGKITTLDINQGVPIFDLSTFAVKYAELQQLQDLIDNNIVKNNALFFTADRMTELDVTPAEMVVGWKPYSGELDSYAGEIILRNSASNQQYNGLWVIQSTGSAVRYSKYDTADNIFRSLVLVHFGQFSGNTYSCASFVNLGVDAIVYTRFYLPNQALATTNSPEFAGGKFGIATDYSEFEADGTLKFNGSATTWEDENFDPTMLTGTGNLPSLGNFGSTTIGIAQFSGSQTDEVLLCKEYPHRAKLNATGETSVKLSFHCHCYPTNTSGGNVRLGLEYFFSCEGQAITTSTIIYITEALPITAWEQKTFAFADIAAPETIGCQYHFRFFRLGADALDTATQALAISTIGFHYESDTVGSRQKTVK